MPAATPEASLALDTNCLPWEHLGATLECPSAPKATDAVTINLSQEEQSELEGVLENDQVETHLPASPRGDLVTPPLLDFALTLGTKGKGPSPAPSHDSEDLALVVDLSPTPPLPEGI